MNKVELVKAIVGESKHNVTTVMAEEMVNSFINIVKNAVASGDKVQLVGFGTFEQTQRAERKCKNPQTGEEIIVPARKVPRFKPGKAFKDIVK